MREQFEIAQEKDSASVFLIGEDFNKIIKSYKLRYDTSDKNGSSLTYQSLTNTHFGIDDEPQAHDKNFKIFLREKINQAFREEDVDDGYFAKINVEARINEDGSVNECGRGIHGGNHVANVTLYSKMLLKLYKKYKDYLPENLKKEVSEFDEKKEKDLEVLALMHDCARINKKHDQDEYKNAFYVALMMRELKDSRFTGENISEEGLDFITNLSLKESGYKDKSLMSKLIQSADSLSITRVQSIVYDPDHSDVIHDFRKIQNEEVRKKILHEFNKLSHVISDYEFFSRSKEEKGDYSKLELIKNPLEVFNKRALEFTNSFSSAIGDPSDAIPEEFKTIMPVKSYPVHVMHPRRKRDTVVEKLSNDRFLNATLILKPDSEVDDAYIRHYANVNWYTSSFLILKPGGVIFLDGVVRDVGSDNLFTINTPGNNDFERTQNFAHQVHLLWNMAIFSSASCTMGQFKNKLEEIMHRRTYPEKDISNTKYGVRTSGSDFEAARIGKDRYNGDDFGRYQNIPIRSPQLIHNECHVYTAIQDVLHLGIAKDFLQNEKIDNSTDNLDLKKITTLRDAVRFKEEINDEKKRLLELEEPMEDKHFKFCVNHEFRRVKTCLEKIVYFERLKDQIAEYSGNNFREVSFRRKAEKKTEFEGKNFEDSPENRAIWFDRKIDKIGKNLISLTKELKSYEKSFDITGLTTFAQNLDCKKDKESQEKINSWINEIMEGKTEKNAVEKVVEKVKLELRNEVKIVAQDMHDPTNLTVIDDEKYLESATKIQAVIAKMELHKDKLKNANIQNIPDLLEFEIFANSKFGVDMVYKLFPVEENRNILFEALKTKYTNVVTGDNFNNFALNKIIKNRDINSLLYLLNTDFIQSEDYKRFPLIHVLEGCLNIIKIKELMNVLTNKGLEIDVNQKDDKGLTILDKMLPTCNAKSLKELLDLGFKTSSGEAIDAILKSKKESVKQVIFENDELRNGLSIKSLKLDAKYNAFFEKLVNGNEQIVSQLIDSLKDYATNRKPSYEFEFDDNKITLSVNKIIDFLDEKKTNNLLGLSFFSYRSNDSEYKSLERRLNDSQRKELESSFNGAKNNCSPHLCASLVIQVSPPLQQIRPPH